MKNNSIHFVSVFVILIFIKGISKYSPYVSSFSNIYWLSLSSGVLVIWHTGSPELNGHISPQLYVWQVT
jgi:hypothetical protein